MTGSSLLSRSSCLPAPDLQSRLSFIDLCCILTEETIDKLADLTSSHLSQPTLTSSHAIPRSQVAHVQSNIQQLILNLHTLQEIVNQHKTQEDEEEEEKQQEETEDHIPHPQTAHTSSSFQEEDSPEEDEWGAEKENSPPKANLLSAHFSPHHVKGKAALELSPLPSTPFSPSRTSHISSSPPSNPSLSTPSPSPGLPSPRSSLSTPPTPSLFPMGLSLATLSLLRLPSSPNRSSTSSIDSLLPFSVNDFPSLRQRLSEGSEGGGGESPAIPQFESILARTPAVMRGMQATDSPLLPNALEFN